MMQSMWQIINANLAESEGIADDAPSNTEHTLHNNRARNGPLYRSIQQQLPRAQSAGIGRFRIDAARVINNLNLDTSVPHNCTLQVPVQENHPDRQQANVRPVQMYQQNYFYVLIRMLRVGMAKSRYSIYRRYRYRRMYMSVDTLFFWYRSGY
jgi:hypothetical protein